jgi:hypothetical protein
LAAIQRLSQALSVELNTQDLSCLKNISVLYEHLGKYDAHHKALEFLKSALTQDNSQDIPSTLLALHNNGPKWVPLTGPTSYISIVDVVHSQAKAALKQMNFSVASTHFHKFFELLREEKKVG